MRANGVASRQLDSCLAMMYNVPLKLVVDHIPHIFAWFRGSMVCGCTHIAGNVGDSFGSPELV